MSPECREDPIKRKRNARIALAGCADGSSEAWGTDACLILLIQEVCERLELPKERESKRGLKGAAGEDTGSGLSSDGT